MLVEGKGIVAPKPVAIRVSHAEVMQLRSISEERNRFRRYAARGDAWGRGFIKDPVFVGLCGEHALCRWVNRRLRLSLHVDSALRERGDGGVDIDIHGLSAQVKTRLHTSRANLVKRYCPIRKQLIPLTGDVYVFATWDATDQRVDLLGWMTTPGMRATAKRVRSPRADSAHHNLEVADALLEPMARLLNEIEIRRASAC